MLGLYQFLGAFLASVSGVVILALLLTSLRRKKQTAMVQALSTRVGLVINDEVAQRLRRRVVARYRGGLIGGYLLEVLGIGLMLMSPAITSGVSGVQVFGGAPVLLFWVGWSLGRAATGFILSERPGADGLSFARSRAVTIDDYLPRRYRLAIWGTAGVTAPLLTIGIALVATAPQPLSPFVRSSSAMIIGATVLAGISAIALLCAEIGSRALVRHGRKADSPAQLAWSDALTASTIRDLYFAAVSGISNVLAWSAVASGFILFDSGRGWLVEIIAASVVVGLIVWEVVRRRSQDRLPEQYYLRRLWPEVAAQGDAIRATEGAAA